MPASLASRRASGDENTRAWPLVRRRGCAAARCRCAERAAGSGSRRPSALRPSRAPGGAAAAFGAGALAGRSRRRLRILALAGQHGDQLVDRHVGGAFRHDDLGQRALVDRLDLHRGLVGLDLGDHVAGLHLLAFLLQPLGEIALLHRGRERGHQDVDRHVWLSAQRAGGAGIGRRVHLGVVHRADALDGLGLAELVSVA